MKRAIFALAVLALAAGRRRAVAYQAVARQRDYSAPADAAATAPCATTRPSAPSRPTAAPSPCGPTRCSPTSAAARPTSGAATAAISKPRRATSARRAGARPGRHAPARGARRRRSTSCSATTARSTAYERVVRLDDRSARVSYKLALARYRDGDVDAALIARSNETRPPRRHAWPTRTTCSASACASSAACPTRSRALETRRGARRPA